MTNPVSGDALTTLMVEVLQSIVEDLEARWDMTDPSTNPGIVENVSQAKKVIAMALLHDD